MSEKDAFINQNSFSLSTANIAPPVWRDFSEYLISEGYFYSANILVGCILNKNCIAKLCENEIFYQNNKFQEINQDELIFPILYCYRHFIELSLKFFICQINNILDNENQKEKILNNHNISKLIKHFKDLYSEMYNNEYTGIKEDEVEKEIETKYEFLTNICIEFENIDKSSFAVRYITDKKGKAYFDEAISIDIEKLTEKMQEIKYIFEQINDMLDILISQKKESYEY